MDRDRTTARHRAIINSTLSFAIVATDRDGVVTEWNPGAEHVLGWSAAEMLGQPADRFFTPEDQEAGRVEVEMSRALQVGRANDERWHMRKDGSRFWASGEMTPLHGEDGAHLGYVKILRDLTIQHEAVVERAAAVAALNDLNASLEEQVAERTAERDRIWANSRDLLGIADDQGVWRSVSPAWTRLLGWKTEEIVGRTSEWMEHPDDQAKTRAEVDSLAAGNATAEFENRFRTREGNYRTLSWTAVPEGGMLYCVARDVTEVRAHETAVGEQIAARERTWHFSPDLLSIIDIPGATFERVNPAWTVSLGWETGEIEGQNYADFVHPEDVDASAAAFERVRLGEPVLRFENRYKQKDGTWRWLSWVAFPEGNKLYSSCRDITDELHAAAELAATQDALRQSQKLEAIGQLTGGVAHDFNNLLTVIRGSIDLMRRGTLPEERRHRHMQAISDTVTRATRLTQQLLAFARRQTLQPEAIDVGKNMRAVSEMLATLTGSRIEIIPYAPVEPCFVNVDPSQFDTALVNMAVNARDAMEGEGTLTIRVRPLSRMPAIRNHPAVDGDFVAVSLTDTGRGIPEDQLDHIFEPFFTTKAAGAGTGLGLSQVFGFAKQSGGEVMVESTVGKGTTFTLYLPRVEAPAEVKEPIAEEEAMDGDGACVLLVEDNEEVGSFATQALIDLGYVAVWSLNAAEALAELEKDAGRFDVVFSDVIMPGMNGIDLAQEIRRRHPDLPVVLTSGYSSVLAEGGTHGFQLLHKPYSVEQMSRVLGKAAGRGRRGNGPRAL